MDFTNYPNTSISGAGSIGGGTFNEVSCSGSAKVSGNITCAKFSASGASKVEGDIDCHGKISVSGAFKGMGNVKGEIFMASGASTVMENVSAKEIKLSGATHIHGDCEGENVEISGAVEIGGLLNAETVTIILEAGGSGNNTIGQIGGGTVIVRTRHRSTSHLFGVFSKGQGLKTSLIEADRVELNNTKAETVRTIDAFIGDGCEIGVLEYSGEVEISENAKIGKTVKI